MVGTGTGFQHHLGGRQVREETRHLAAVQVTPQHRAIRRIIPMQGESALGRAYGHALQRHDGRLPVRMVTSAKLWHELPRGRVPQQTPGAQHRGCQDHARDIDAGVSGAARPPQRCFIHKLIHSFLHHPARRPSATQAAPSPIRKPL